jgi:hypothetical protein
MAGKPGDFLAVGILRMLKPALCQQIPGRQRKVACRMGKGAKGAAGGSNQCARLVPMPLQQRLRVAVAYVNKRNSG